MAKTFWESTLGSNTTIEDMPYAFSYIYWMVVREFEELETYIYIVEEYMVGFNTLFSLLIARPKWKYQWNFDGTSDIRTYVFLFVFFSSQIQISMYLKICTKGASLSISKFLFLSFFVVSVVGLVFHKKKK